MQEVTGGEFMDLGLNPSSEKGSRAVLHTKVIGKYWEAKFGTELVGKIKNMFSVQQMSAFY